MGHWRASRTLGLSDTWTMTDDDEVDRLVKWAKRLSDNASSTILVAKVGCASKQSGVPTMIQEIPKAQCVRGHPPSMV